ncbi:LysR substrate-binding domain-containing protein [Streptomyces sp. 142MFCol3.1]|uniref:LysR substrate-binding domain-containing protein n=1 Tax=Streptomyces sp. 142MFCol3.1 TaxID=1172179 RepID=UPI000683FF1D|nr:LysR substrate-binding domain-containing protein [Streptomyces sp. 142MFCol3.1]
MFIGYFVGPMAAEFHTSHPGISLSLKEMTQDRMEAALLADDIDLGVAFDAPHQRGIHAARMFTKSLGLVVGPDYPRDLKSKALAVRDLATLQLAILGSDVATRSHIDSYFGRHRVSPRIAIEANSIQALIEIGRHTTLATVLPETDTDDHPQLATVTLARAHRGATPTAGRLPERCIPSFRRPHVPPRREPRLRLTAAGARMTWCDASPVPPGSRIVTAVHREQAGVRAVGKAEDARRVTDVGCVRSSS